MRLVIDREDLVPLVEAVVAEVLAKLGTNGNDGRLAYTEAEAAELLGMAPHQLRDRRLEGEIKAKKLGRAFYYSKSELMRFIAAK